MPTEMDLYEAILDGRWQPQIQHETVKDGFKATYQQGEKVVERFSKWTPQQAEDDLRAELLRGALEGEYFPTNT